MLHEMEVIRVRAFCATTLLGIAMLTAGCSTSFDRFRFGAAGSGGMAGSAGRSAAAGNQTAGIDAVVPCTSDISCDSAFQCKSKICVMRR